MKMRLIGATCSLAALLLTSCEDQGNPGDDNLLTGASLAVVVVIVLGVVLLMRRRR